MSVVTVCFSRYLKLRMQNVNRVCSGMVVKKVDAIKAKINDLQITKRVLENYQFYEQAITGQWMRYLK